MAKASFSSVLSVPGFRYIWINQFLAQLAYNTLNYALVVWVYKLTNSNFAVSIIILCVYLPSLLLGVFGGLLADVIDKKKILMATCFLYAVAYLIFIPIKGIYPLIIINTFFLNSMSQFFVPAESSAIPLLINKKGLFFANSLFSLTLYVSLLIGFTSSGIILNKLGMNTVFMLGFVFQLIGFMVILRLPSLKNKQLTPYSRKFVSDYKKDGSIITGLIIKDVFLLARDETRETFQFIRGKVNLSVAIALLAAMQGIIGTLAVLVSSYLERVLRIHATDASYFLMFPLGTGMILGAVLLGRFGSKVPRRFIVVPSIVTAGIVFILMGLIPYFAHLGSLVDLPPYHIPKLRYFFKAPSLSTWFAIGSFILGFCSVSIIVPSQTVVQEATTDKVRGKIMSILVVLMNCASAILVLTTGALADLIGVAPVFTILGLSILLIGMVALKPQLFIKEGQIPFRIKEFLGLGHWRQHVLKKY